MKLDVALSQYGIAEIKGEKHNPEVLRYFHDIGHKWVLDDETGWCAAFVNWCLLQAGVKGTGKLNAKSFVDWGEEVKTPVPGDIAVFDRGGAFGHVGFFIRQTSKYIYLLGGNQGDCVSIVKEDISKLISIRREPKSQTESQTKSNAYISLAQDVIDFLQKQIH